jgi:hypothetical protein
MNIEKYLEIINSYIDSNLQSTIDGLPKEKLKKIGGFVLLNMAPVSASETNKVLIRESAFYDYKDLEYIFVSNGKVANDIYISPLASSDNSLILQIHIDSWRGLSGLNEDLLFIRSHGLPMANNFKDKYEKYKPLPSYQIVPDNQRWVVDTLDLNGMPKELRRKKAVTSLRQILEGFEITDDFKDSLKKSFFKEDDKNTLSTILEILGLVEIEGALEMLNKYLMGPDHDLRVISFISAIDFYFVNLKDQLISCYRDEMDVQNRFIMLNNIVRGDKLSIKEISDLIAGIDLTKREKRLLERKGLV